MFLKYILSCIVCYFVIRKFHMIENTKPEKIDVVSVFLPYLNTIFAITGILILVIYFIVNTIAKILKRLNVNVEKFFRL